MMLKKVFANAGFKVQKRKITKDIKLQKNSPLPVGLVSWGFKCTKIVYLFINTSFIKNIHAH